VSKFSIEVVKKTAASAHNSQSAFLFTYNCSSQIAYLISWRNTIFGYKLRIE